MLKPLVIVGLLLAAPLVPGQPDKAADHKQQPASQGQPAVALPDSQNKQANSQANQPKPDPDAPKWYTSLERPDWWLVIIAGLTGCVIGWQSWETRKAANGAQRAADASFDQIEFMKSKERAQLRLELDSPSLDYVVTVSGTGFQLIFSVILDGTTRAYVLEDSLIAYVADRSAEKRGRPTIGLPRNFTPEASPVRTFTLLQKDGLYPEIETDRQKVIAARQGKLGIFVNGRIRYRDVFGDEWILEIDRHWDAGFGDWFPTSSGRYDTHRKADTSRRDEYLKKLKAN